MSVAELVPGKSDTDKAAHYREKMKPLLDQMCVLFTDARSDGLILGFTINNDQFNRFRGELNITKPL